MFKVNVMSIFKRMAKPKTEKVVAAAPRKRAVAPKAVVATSDRKVVEFEHATVVEILPGRTVDVRVHCKMSDGTTKHVPRKLLEEAGWELPAVEEVAGKEDADEE